MPRILSGFRLPFGPVGEARRRSSAPKVRNAKAVPVTRVRPPGHRERFLIVRSHRGKVVVHHRSDDGTAALETWEQLQSAGHPGIHLFFDGEQLRGQVQR